MKETLETQKINADLLILDAYRKAGDLYKPVDMDKFKGTYGDQKIEADKARVEELRAIFKESHKDDSEEIKNIHRIAKTFEMIFFDQAGDSKWLGENAKTLQVSKYDDLENGVDSVVEFTPEGSYSILALAIDITSSHELTRKFDRIKKEIDNGKLTELSYFKSEAFNFMGRKFNIPRVIIGADRKVLFDLMEKWLDKDKTALAEHVIQAIIIEEIIDQLEVFVRYAESKGKQNIVDIYKDTLSILMRIKKSSKIPEDLLYEAREDHVFAAITECLSTFK
jgi:hypothetical protein